MVIVIDPFVAGLSGDMILSSLVDLGANKIKILDGIKSCEKFLPDSIIKKIEFTSQSNNLTTPIFNLII